MHAQGHDADQGRHIRQAYLAASADHSIRIRIIEDRDAWLTIKSGYRGIVRDEFEYAVPLADALAMLDLCQGGIIDTTRYRVSAGDRVWDIDRILGLLTTKSPTRSPAYRSFSRMTRST